MTVNLHACRVRQIDVNVSMEGPQCSVVVYYEVEDDENADAETAAKWLTLPEALAVASMWERCAEAEYDHPEGELRFLFPAAAAMKGDAGAG